LWIIIDDIVPVEMLITDSAGRCTGLDPLSGDSCSEIPNAVYYGEYIESPDGEAGMGSKEIEIRCPAGGEYKLRVTALAEGAYELGIRGYDADGNSFDGDFGKVQATQNAIHVYTVAFDKTSAAASAVSGGFRGSNNEAADIDRLISYANVSTTQTDLPVGTGKFGLYLIYGDSILPETFSASLNEQDVSGSFTPGAGGYETVSMPVQSGQNVLVMTILGNKSDGTVTDTDSLIFMVE
jgi:hypothetical protein